ncbi:MAG: Holliday junction branch migration protein RuvA [Clostridia bacterium]|jgi:Holliday junction DNA helicase RuvA|nr:Holliday junction branch migration protein RuvA [Clostridia bacterium]
MIAFVRGIVWDIREDSLIIDVNGVGYKVYVPIAAFDDMPIKGEEITLHTYMQLREDSCTLFGFEDTEQLYVFNLLLGVNGVGAKVALAVLNTLTPTDVIFAVQVNNIDVFKSVSGIGKKIAERIVMELKDKCGKAKIPAQNIHINETQAVGNHDQAVTALTRLGYNSSDAAKMVQMAMHELPQNTALETIITTALRLAAK